MGLTLISSRNSFAALPVPSTQAAKPIPIPLAAAPAAAWLVSTPSAAPAAKAAPVSQPVAATPAASAAPAAKATPASQAAKASPVSQPVSTAPAASSAPAASAASAAKYSPVSQPVPAAHPAWKGPPPVLVAKPEPKTQQSLPVQETPVKQTTLTSPEPQRKQQSGPAAVLAPQRDSRETPLSQGQALMVSMSASVLPNLQKVFGGQFKMYPGLAQSLQKSLKPGSVSQAFIVALEKNAKAVAALRSSPAPRVSQLDASWEKLTRSFHLFKEWCHKSMPPEIVEEMINLWGLNSLSKEQFRPSTEDASADQTAPSAPLRPGQPFDRVQAGSPSSCSKETAEPRAMNPVVFYDHLNPGPYA